jgi:hypothetical protein
MIAKILLGLITCSFFVFSNAAQATWFIRAKTGVDVSSVKNEIILTDGKDAGKNITVDGKWGVGWISGISGGGYHTFRGGSVFGAGATISGCTTKSHTDGPQHVYLTVDGTSLGGAAGAQVMDGVIDIPKARAPVSYGAELFAGHHITTNTMVLIKAGVEFAPIKTNSIGVLSGKYVIYNTDQDHVSILQDGITYEFDKNGCGGTTNTSANILVGAEFHRTFCKNLTWGVGGEFVMGVSGKTKYSGPNNEITATKNGSDIKLMPLSSCCDLKQQKNTFRTYLSLGTKW